MGRPTVSIELASDARLSRDLEAGGVFVPDCVLELNSECELVVRGSTTELRVAARVVWIDPQRGAGLELIGFGSDMKDRLVALAAAAPELARGSATGPTLADAIVGDATEPITEPLGVEDLDDEDEASAEAANRKPLARHAHERLRGLTIVEQLKVAQSREMHERVVLERIYGKTVWEALLHNPRLTAPEVVRIARMGQLPRVLIELIVNNGAWLQMQEVRRALLANPKLGVDQVMRILRLLPRHELRLATTQTAYPMAVRDAARKLAREG